MSKALRGRGYLDKAEALLHQAIANYPKDLELVAERAEIAMARHDWPEAVKQWQAVLDIAGDQTPKSAFLGMSKALRKQGDFGKAEGAIRQAIANYPKDLELVAERAEIAMARRDWPEAVKQWQALLDVAGDQAPKSTYLGLSKSLRKQGDVDEAEGIIYQAIDHYPKDLELVAERAEIAMARHDWPEAVKQWQAVLDVAGGRAPKNAFLGMSKALRKKGDIDKTKAIIDQAIDHYPKDLKLVAERAEIAMARHDWPEAMKFILGVRAGLPDYLRLAKVFSLQDESKAAEIVLRSGLGLYPDDPTLTREHAKIRHSQPSGRVRDLGGFLFSGFSEPSIAELEKVRRDSNRAKSDRIEASWDLSRYFAYQGEWEKSLDRLIFCSTVAPADWLRRTAVEVLKAECLTRLSLPNEAYELLQRHLVFLKSRPSSPYIDLANCYLALSNVVRCAGNDDPLIWVNQIYKDFGLRTLELKDRSRPLSFENIAGAEKSKIIAEGNKTAIVSVIVPAYNAADTIHFTLLSLLDQSWDDIEILVVDDASTDKTYDIACEMASSDARIHVVKHSENRGAYAGRNTGFNHATGDVIATLDGDDFAHPDLVKSAMDVFQERPDVLAATSYWVRVTETLHFKVRPLRGGQAFGPIHSNFSSMFLRRELLEKLGGWDSVRINADAELRRRVAIATESQQRAEILPGVPLTFALSRDSSLTSSHKTGIISLHYGAREEYQQAADSYSEVLRDKGEYRLVRKSAKDPFPVPRLMVSQSRSKHDYDVVLVSDFTRPGGTTSCNENYIKAAVEDGLSVGLIHWPRFDLKREQVLNPKIRKLLSLSEVHRIVPGDDISSRLTIIHHPPILRWFPNWLERHEHDGLMVLVNQLPSQWRNRDECQYDIPSAHEQLLAVYGSTPYWYGISPPVTQYLKQQSDFVSNDIWYPPLDLDEWTPKATSRVRDLPVIGRHSRDHETKWPEDEQALRSAFLVGSKLDVKLLGGANKALEILKAQPENWHIYDFDELSVITFLKSLDFFIHYTHSQYFEEFGRNIMEAMAVGVPVIVPDSFEAIFGDAATYAPPEAVESVISGMWNDESLYKRQVRAGRNFVERYCSLQTFPRRFENALKLASP